uniref:Myb-like domain-containing protein n=1 Tax=Pygocentrus nattereri TaxID=42514 RepID=A0A3B4EGI6_PYGNA
MTYVLNLFFPAIKTDLHLLLECLKYQMKCPDSQKQALLTIVSICQQNEFFKEIGGVRFIYNLSRSSHYSEVKETALFSLGSLAEFNESCKQALCREETFCDLAQCMKHEVYHTQKRVAVYMLCVLVSNNSKTGCYARHSGQMFIFLFYIPVPEENQNACMCMLPRVKTWLQQVSVSKAELVQPICSFIGMAVANNTCVQEYFASVGGLFTLTDTLASVAPQCKDSPVACKIAVMITRTLSACIADNEALAPVVSKLRVVPDLLLLLSSPNLCPRDQLAVVLTLGHCTDACVEHQSELMLGGGLPLMISLLTDANDEEVRKAAIFVLQTCKKISELHTLSYDLSVMHVILRYKVVISNIVTVTCCYFSLCFFLVLVIHAHFTPSIMQLFCCWFCVSGCVSGVDEVNSHSIGTMLRSCSCLCEFHQVLQQAEDRFKRSLKHEHSMHTGQASDARMFESTSKHGSMKKKRRLGYTDRPNHWDAVKCSQKIRKNYSADELVFLNEGVRRFGNSWNSILWAYPFQNGRSNIDLAKKYRQDTEPSAAILCCGNLFQLLI